MDNKKTHQVTKRTGFFLPVIEIDNFKDTQTPFKLGSMAILSGKKVDFYNV